MNQHIAEKIGFSSGFVPVNMQTGNNPGDFVSLKDYQRLAIVFFKGIGTAGDDPTITLQQATSVGGAGAKPLPFSRVDKKQGLDLTTIAQMTTSTVDNPANHDTFSPADGTYTNSDLAEQSAIIVIDIKAEDLDINNGYEAVQASIADVGTHTQIGCILYLAHDPKYATDPAQSDITE